MYFVKNKREMNKKYTYGVLKQDLCINTNIYCKQNLKITLYKLCIWFICLLYIYFTILGGEYFVNIIEKAD